MAMTRRDPFGPGWLERLGGFSNLRRFFDEDDDQLRVEQFVEGDNLVIRAELPGIDPNRDVDIEVRDGALHIRAQRRQEERKEERGYYLTEFRYGAFTRVIPLAPGASEEDIKANYKDGILEVRVPIDRSKSEAKRIAVNRD